MRHLQSAFMNLFMLCCKCSKFVCGVFVNDKFFFKNTGFMNFIVSVPVKLISVLQSIISLNASGMTYQSLGGGILICFLLNLTLVTFSSFLLRLEVSVIKPNRHEKFYKSLFFSFSHKLSTFLRNGDFLYYIVSIAAIIFLQSNCSIKNNLTIKVQTYVKINKVYFLINNIWKRRNHRIFL